MTDQPNHNGEPAATALSEEDLEHFRTLLLKRRRQATDDIDRMRLQLADVQERARDESAYSSDVADSASGMRERQELYRMIARQQKYVGHLDRALGRIDSGTYGICRVTGRPISKERLQAVPHTTTSIDAKRQRT